MHSRRQACFRRFPFWRRRILAPVLVCLLPSFSPFSDEEPKNLTDVKIEGLEGLSEKDVLTRLGGRLDFITSRSPSRSRADDADFLVSRLLEKEGYSDVTISWKIPEDRKSIILRVTSGPRLTIGDVTVQGVEGEDADIMKQYFTGKSLLGGTTDVPYLPEEVEEASKNSIVYLKAQGYWEAKGTLAPPAIDLESRKVDLAVNATPGPLHKIVSVNIDGKLIPELPKLPKSIQRFVGKTSTAETLREVRDGTTASMREEGYQFANSVLEADHQNGETRLNLILEPGSRFRLRQTLITGAEGTDISRVRKLANRSAGQPYDEKKITKLRNSILATGAFNAVDRDRVIDKDARAIDITLHLKEGKPKGISYYLGAGSIEGFIVGASYYDRNFLSKLYNFNVAAEYSNIGALGQVSVTDPFVLGYDLRATPRAFALTRTYDEYFKFEVGAGLRVAYDITERQLLELDAQFSYATVSPEDLPESALGATDYLFTSIGATYFYDSRDSKASPTKGFYARLRGEIGGVAAETNNAFLRFEGQAAYHLPINEKNRLSFNVRTGILAPADGENLPVDLRYFIGGSDSVRSFPFRELGPNLDGTARGGEAFWYTNVEYIRKIAGPIYGVVFLDAGSLEEDAASWPSFDPKLAAGLGIRVDLPIGPIRFEYGRALNPAPEDPSGAFHFAIGASF